MKRILLLISFILASSVQVQSAVLERHMSNEVDITDFSKLVCKNKYQVERQIRWFLKYESRVNVEEAYMINEGLSYGLDEEESKKMADKYFRGARIFYNQQLESITENYLNCTSPQNGDITP